MNSVRYQKLFVVLIAVATATIGLLHIERIAASRFGSATAYEVQPIVFSSDDPEKVYSDDPRDPWNRIFHSLFTRKVNARLSDDFPEAAPFTHPAGDIPFRLFTRVSTRTFERVEPGDRAIEPLYPGFFDDGGVRELLTEPHYSEFREALAEALADKQARPPLARALMQSDAWAAYDTLFSRKRAADPQPVLSTKKIDALLLLLSRFVTKLALTPEEIQGLPDNYEQAAISLSLPDAFTPGGPWVEIGRSAHRQHDEAVNYRRSARVFIKRHGALSDATSFIKDVEDNPYLSLDGVLLLVQDLLIDTNGRVVPTHLTKDIQVRMFAKNDRGLIDKIIVAEYELSRKSLLNSLTRGGFIEFGEKAPMYFPAAGNDYLFASPQLTRQAPDFPVLVTLRRRCEGCHGPGNSAIFSVGTTLAGSGPSFRILDPRANTHSSSVAASKQTRADLRLLEQQNR